MNYLLSLHVTNDDGFTLVREWPIESHLNTTQMADFIETTFYKKAPKRKTWTCCGGFVIPTDKKCPICGERY
mgnify:CR=1 FL=1